MGGETGDFYRFGLGWVGGEHGRVSCHTGSSFANSIKKSDQIIKQQLELPEFANEDEERAFWAGVDLSHYFVPDDFVPVSFPNLKPTSRAISIRFPEYVLDAVKVKANEMGVSYQTLIKEAVIKAYVTKHS